MIESIHTNDIKNPEKKSVLGPQIVSTPMTLPPQPGKRKEKKRKEKKRKSEKEREEHGKKKSSKIQVAMRYNTKWAFIGGLHCYSF